MANRYTWTLKKIAKRLRDGYGTGSGAEYKPFLTVFDVPSSTTVSRILGVKTGRIHHYFSFLEVSFHYVLEYSQKVIDIREQYPLPLNETIDIAQRLGIYHPGFYRGGKVPFVVTTDFLVDYSLNDKVRLLARALKPSDLLKNARTREKLEIERLFWNKRNIDWGIITEQQMPTSLIKNLEWIHSGGLFWNYNQLSFSQIIDISECLIDKINEGIPLLMAGKAADVSLNVKLGSAMTVFRFLISSHVLSIDLFSPIDIGKPIAIIPTGISVESAVENYERDYSQFYHRIYK